MTQRSRDIAEHAHSGLERLDRAYAAGYDAKHRPDLHAAGADGCRRASSTSVCAPR